MMVANEAKTMSISSVKVVLKCILCVSCKVKVQNNFCIVTTKKDGY